MMDLLKNIRFWVLAFSFLLLLGEYVLVSVNTIEELRNVRITQIFALTAFSYLYLALLCSPLYYAFPRLMLRAQYFKARRSVGISAFFFGIVHAWFAFFGELEGFEGLAYLDQRYIIGISLSATALLILATMAATSFDGMVAKLTFRRWKMLHRFVYVAATLVLVHAILLGSHFRELSTAIPGIVFVAVLILLLLQGYRIGSWFHRRMLNRLVR